MKVRVTILILFIIFILLQGCAHFSEKKYGQITSIPADASIYLEQPSLNTKEFIGTTPLDYYIQYGLVDIYVVAEKSEYKTERFLIPRSGDISHLFIFEHSYSWKIAQEEPNLTKEYKKDVSSILGIFDKVLNSPRMLASGVVSDARSQIQGLVIDYPEYSDSETVKGLKELLKAADYVTNLSSTYYNTAKEANGVRNVRELIEEIKAGLGFNI